MPVYSQHLLVLLIGTFRVIHANSERAKTGMTAEALGVSVAPSFFHTCCLEGKIAKPEEVQKFKVNLITFVYLPFFLEGIIHIYLSTFTGFLIPPPLPHPFGTSYLYGHKCGFLNKEKLPLTETPPLLTRKGLHNI